MMILMVLLMLMPLWVRCLEFLQGQIIWDPVLRSDIGWNFEKFLINQVRLSSP